MQIYSFAVTIMGLYLRIFFFLFGGSYSQHERLQSNKHLFYISFVSHCFLILRNVPVITELLNHRLSPKHSNFQTQTGARRLPFRDGRTAQRTSKSILFIDSGRERKKCWIIPSHFGVDTCGFQNSMKSSVSQLSQTPSLFVGEAFLRENLIFFLSFSILYSFR